MRRQILVLAAAALVTALACRGAHADSDTETRLRDALRNAISQVRTLEDERAALQAKQAESDKQVQALQAQVDQLSKDGGGKTAKKDEAAYDEAVAEFNRRLSSQNDTIGKLDGAIDKWKAAYNEALSAARAKEAERAKLATQIGDLTQRATSCEAKNAELFKVGNEILDRYKNVSFGDVLADREPFIGTSRVKLQNIVQDYEDKLLDQKATSGGEK
jgi:chromosome segregation ATPase